MASVPVVAIDQIGQLSCPNPACIVAVVISPLPDRSLDEAIGLAD